MLRIASPTAGARPATVIGGAVTLTVLMTLLATQLVGGAATAQSQLAGVRRATAAFHDLAVAETAGYGAFHVCTEEPGVGAMGQHFANGALVGDAVIDAEQPEVLVYEPKASGGYRLVAVEYVVFAEAWDAENSAPPVLYDRTFSLIPAPNRYGLPPFYELHAWLWEPNPSGLFNDWNPNVSCQHAEME